MFLRDSRGFKKYNCLEPVWINLFFSKQQSQQLHFMEARFGNPLQTLSTEEVQISIFFIFFFSDIVFLDAIFFCKI